MDAGPRRAAFCRRVAPILAATLILSPFQAFAEEPEGGRLAFAGDLYVAGEAPEGLGAAEGSVFAAGERLTLEGPTARVAHLAGRWVSVAAPVGGNLYAAGYEIEVGAPVAGDATLAAHEVEVSAPIGGVLRAVATEVRVGAPTGALLILAERVTLDGEVAGDAHIRAEEIVLGPDARILGTLSVPEDVTFLPADREVPAARLEKLAEAEWEGPGPVAAVVGAVLGLLGTAGVVLAVQALFVGAAPRWSEALAFDVAERPFRSLGVGFVALSALVGAAPVLAMTLVGAPLIVAVVLALPLAGLAGVALGAWALGVGLWRVLDRPAPEGFWRRLGIAALGLAVLGVLSLVPILGWVLLVAVTLAGIGAAGTRLAGKAPRAV